MIAVFACAVAVGCRPDVATPDVATPDVATTPRMAAPTKWTCGGDADCVMSCSQGAVNDRWYQAWSNQDPLLECDDGCAEGNFAKCFDGSCIAIDEFGKLNRGCSHREHGP